MKRPDFLRHIDFALLSSLSSFSFFLFERFLFFSREGGKREREREDTPSFPRAREQTRLEEQRERERDLFLLRKMSSSEQIEQMKRLF